MHFDNNVDNQAGTLPLLHRPLFQAMKNGFFHKCPSCGESPLYTSYLKVTDTCTTCRTDLHHHRADDAPAYFTIAIVGKIIVGLFVWFELAYAPSYWLHAAVFIPLLLVMSLLFLPRVKGILVGLQWANYMHGFNPDFNEGDDVELPPSDRLAEQST